MQKPKSKITRKLIQVFGRSCKIPWQEKEEYGSCRLWWWAEERGEEDHFGWNHEEHDRSWTCREDYCKEQGNVEIRLTIAKQGELKKFPFFCK